MNKHDHGDLLESSSVAFLFSVLLEVSQSRLGGCVSLLLLISGETSFCSAKLVT